MAIKETFKKVIFPLFFLKDKVELPVVGSKILAGNQGCDSPFLVGIRNALRIPTFDVEYDYAIFCMIMLMFDIETNPGPGTYLLAQTFSYFFGHCSDIEQGVAVVAFSVLILTGLNKVYCLSGVDLWVSMKLDNIKNRLRPRRRTFLPLPCSDHIGMMKYVYDGMQKQSVKSFGYDYLKNLCVVLESLTLRPEYSALRHSHNNSSNQKFDFNVPLGGKWSLFMNVNSDVKDCSQTPLGSIVVGQVSRNMPKVGSHNWKSSKFDNIVAHGCDGRSFHFRSFVNTGLINDNIGLLELLSAKTAVPWIKRHGHMFLVSNSYLLRLVYQCFRIHPMFVVFVARACVVSRQFSSQLYVTKQIKFACETHQRYHNSVDNIMVSVHRYGPCDLFNLNARKIIDVESEIVKVIETYWIAPNVKEIYEVHFDSVVVVMRYRRVDYRELNVDGETLRSYILFCLMTIEKNPGPGSQFGSDTNVDVPVRRNLSSEKGGKEEIRPSSTSSKNDSSCSNNSTKSKVNNQQRQKKNFKNTNKKTSSKNDKIDKSNLDEIAQLRGEIDALREKHREKLENVEKRVIIPYRALEFEEGKTYLIDNDVLKPYDLSCLVKYCILQFVFCSLTACYSGVLYNDLGLLFSAMFVIVVFQLCSVNPLWSKIVMNCVVWEVLSKNESRVDLDHRSDMACSSKLKRTDPNVYSVRRATFFNYDRFCKESNLIDFMFCKIFMKFVGRFMHRIDRKVYNISFDLVSDIATTDLLSVRLNEKDFVVKLEQTISRIHSVNIDRYDFLNDKEVWSDTYIFCLEYFRSRVAKIGSLKIYTPTHGIVTMSSVIDRMMSNSLDHVR